MRLDRRMVTIATANVNGIRAAYRNGMGEWPRPAKPRDPAAPRRSARPTRSSRVCSAKAGTVSTRPATSRGRAGVAIATTLRSRLLRVGLGNGEPEVPSTPVAGSRPTSSSRRGRPSRSSPSTPLGHRRHAEDGPEVRAPRKVGRAHARAPRERRPRGRRRGRQNRPPERRHQELEGQPQVGRIPARGACLPRPLVRGRLVTLGRRHGGEGPGRTRGGPTVVSPSPTTPGGASTTSSSRRRLWPSSRRTCTSTGRLLRGALERHAPLLADYAL